MRAPHDQCLTHALTTIYVNYPRILAAIPLCRFFHSPGDVTVASVVPRKPKRMPINGLPAGIAAPSGPIMSPTLGGNSNLTGLPRLYTVPAAPVATSGHHG